MKTILFHNSASLPIKAFVLGIISFFLFSQLGWSSDLLPDMSHQIAEKTAVSESNTLPSASTPGPGQGELTQDFLLQSSPLSKPTADNEKTELTIVAVSGPGKECTSSGDSDLGSQSCLQREADGRFSESTLEW